MSFLLDKKLEHESKCEAAITAGQFRDAIFHAAKAAEFAYSLARQTDGKIARRYVEDADGWLDIAERLKTDPPKQKTQNRQSRKPIKDSKDSDSPDDPWLVTKKPSITFDMIYGMEDAKQTIREMIIYPLKQPEKARALGITAGGGVLLFGPPGNGKTTLGKAIANELDAAFYYASGAQIRSKWHGESEQRLRDLIRQARENPIAILFLDDVDGLLPKRGGNSVVDNRIVVQFLSEVGGFEENDNILLILGATNLPWGIDEAVFRTGRFDEKIFIGLPDEPARLGMLHAHLDEITLEEGFDFNKWANRLDGYTGSDLVGIINAAKRSTLSRCVKDNTDPIISINDLEDAFKNIPPSVTPRLMKKYQDFLEARF